MPAPVKPRPGGHSEGQQHAALGAVSCQSIIVSPLFPSASSLKTGLSLALMAGLRAWLGAADQQHFVSPAGTSSRSWSAHWTEVSAELGPLCVWVKKYAAWAVVIAAWATELQSTSTPQGHNIFSRFTTRSFILEFLCQLRLQGGDSGKLVLGPSKRESCNWAPVLKKGARKQHKTSKAKRVTFTRQQPTGLGWGVGNDSFGGLLSLLAWHSADGQLEPRVPEKLLIPLGLASYNRILFLSLKVPWGVRDHGLLKASPYPQKAGFTIKYHGEVKMMGFGVRKTWVWIVHTTTYWMSFGRCFTSFSFSFHICF